MEVNVDLISESTAKRQMNLFNRIQLIDLQIKAFKEPIINQEPFGFLCQKPQRRAKTIVHRPIRKAKVIDSFLISKKGNVSETSEGEYSSATSESDTEKKSSSHGKSDQAPITDEDIHKLFPDFDENIKRHNEEVQKFPALAEPPPALSAEEIYEFFTNE